MDFEDGWQIDPVSGKYRYWENGRWEDEPAPASTAVDPGYSPAINAMAPAHHGANPPAYAQTSYASYEPANKPRKSGPNLVMILVVGLVIAGVSFFMRGGLDLLDRGNNSAEFANGTWSLSVPGAFDTSAADRVIADQMETLVDAEIAEVVGVWSRGGGADSTHVLAISLDIPGSADVLSAAIAEANPTTAGESEQFEPGAPVWGEAPDGSMSVYVTGTYVADGVERVMTSYFRAVGDQTLQLTVAGPHGGGVETLAISVGESAAALS